MNYPMGCKTSDLPGFRDRDVKRDRAFDSADSDVRAGRFDSDDVIAALRFAIQDDWKGIKAAITSNDDCALGDAISTALREYLAEVILRE